MRLEQLECRQMLAITVDVDFDEQDNNISPGNDVSLRDAIILAPQGETIDFAPSLNGATIDLTLGEIAFNKDLTIDASMLPSGITIDASSADNNPAVVSGGGIRIFNITGGDVTLNNLTLQGGDVNGNGGAIRAVGDVSLTLDGVTVRDSGAVFNGFLYLLSGADNFR